MGPFGKAMARVAMGVVVALVLLPLAFSAALPTLARIAGGPAPHVCHCEVRGGHSTCACPICHRDREELLFSRESIRGRCGDDDAFHGSRLDVAVLPPPLLFVRAPLAAVAPLPREAARPESVRSPPPTPPPRRALA